MKKLLLTIIMLSIGITGCAKQEDPATEVTATEVPTEETVEKSASFKDSAHSLMASGTKEVGKGVEAAAAKVDFKNLSWDKVSNVSFEDKMKLVGWATGQADSWKEKLTNAATSQGMSQGMNMLGKMGQGGWQDSFATVLESINKVRESSPETYELARGALVGAWTTFEKQASAFLGK